MEKHFETAKHFSKLYLPRIYLTLVMLRLCIDGLICKLANYTFINFKTYHSAQWSDFDDLYIKTIRGAQGFDL